MTKDDELKELSRMNTKYLMQNDKIEEQEKIISELSIDRDNWKSLSSTYYDNWISCKLRIEKALEVVEAQKPECCSKCIKEILEGKQ